MPERAIVVVAYDPAWPRAFGQIRAYLERAVGGHALDIEHVGSTAVPGLSAKPIIDVDVIVRPGEVAEAIRRLERIGYVHEGDLGIPDREAFTSPAGLPAHHLYVCSAGSTSMQAHLRFRDYLRTHPQAADEYGALKRTLALQVGGDRIAYSAGKKAFIEAALRSSAPTAGRDSRTRC